MKLTAPAPQKRAPAWAALVVGLAYAAVLPLLVVYGVGPTSTRRAVRWLAWAGGLILTVYGLVLTAAGLAIQAGVVPAASHANHRALEWHAYLWDPWFLVWGLLAIVALRRTPPIRIGQTESSATWLR